MTRVILLPLLTLLPFLTLAQELFSADTALWTRFRTFESRLQAQPVRSEAAAALDEYRLVWVEHNNGYSVSITPGDSTVTLQSMLPRERLIHASEATEGVTFHGERNAVLVWDVPVGMLDLKQWYFERKP